ncbi:hypothetical protein EZS27_012446 [termite gut metagenome]|uniref:IPT/TIG domain-containing protein n=1 Tax=termite gut metagenome TaxID=433724 RepID=A0A5J4S1I1_9ZZZZ
MAKFFLICMCCFVMFAGCNDNDNKTGGSNIVYNPDLPVEVITFMPDSGRIREKVMIKGSNFGNDKSKVKVVFEDELTERIATVIGVDNNTVYCLAPRQIAGRNKIKVIAYEQEATCDETFLYSAAENVSSISGNSANTGSEDGSLADAKFSYMHGIGALGNDAVLVFQRDNPAVRYVSVPDNAVITVHKGFQAGKPAVTKDKTKVYATGWDSPHVVYMYTKETGWSPMRIGQIGTAYTRIRALALDETEEWLYFCDRLGAFGRFEIKTQQVEILNETTGVLTTGDGGYLVYSSQADCFYLSVQGAFGVYKISKDGKEVTNFAGFAGSSVRDGYLLECSFAQPNGMTLDEDGNIYIVEGQNGYIIRKISIIDGYVSTVAGAVNSASQIDGDPFNARFNYPYDIANDGEGNYWIVEGWGCAVRKYAIE